MHMGLIGYPLGHSYSPILHNAALKHAGLKGEYALFPIPTDNPDGLENILTRVRTGELIGLNVTIPYKRKVISLLDELTSTAEHIGAVNTIYFKDGLLIGDNTDAPGFIADLNAHLPVQTKKQDHKHALILGAGGAARSIVYALLNEGWHICITARRMEQAQAIIDHFPYHRSNLITAKMDPDKMLSHLDGLDLVVNTTPVGMHPDNHSPWPQDLVYPESALFYDLVYNPRETQLIKDVRAVGLKAVSGIGMLVEQAALAFEKWTNGIKVQDVMRKAMEEEE